MKKLGLILFSLLILATPSCARRFGNVTVLGDLNIPHSDAIPATCTQGDQYMDTNAPTGQQHYLCESANTWVLQGGSGSGAGDISEVGLCTSGACTSDFINSSHIVDNTIDSEHYVDGSIDSVHIAADAIDGTKIADDAIDSEHYVDGSIDYVNVNITNAATDEWILSYEVDSDAFQWKDGSGAAGYWEQTGSIVYEDDGPVVVGGSTVEDAGVEFEVIGNAEFDNVNVAGVATFANSITFGGTEGITFTNNTSGSLIIADGTDFGEVVITGDVTIDSAGVTTIPDNQVSESMLKVVNNATDEYVLTYESTTGDFEWEDLSAIDQIDTKCIYWEDPTAADDFQSVWTTNGFAATITKIWCESDQTVNMDLAVDSGTVNDVNGSDLICDSTPAEDETMGGDATMADGDRLDFAVTSVSGTPTWASICWTYTID